jgi:hypothetical protein
VSIIRLVGVADTGVKSHIMPLGSEKAGSTVRLDRDFRLHEKHG